MRAAKLGPIDAWYIAGFDGGERELIGFTTSKCNISSILIMLQLAHHTGPGESGIDQIDAC